MIEDNSASRKQYEEWHINYNANIVKMDELKLMAWHKTVLELLLKNDISSKKILEVGCGNGDFSNYLSLHHKATITGVDFSNESIRIANQKKEKFNTNTASFDVADAESLPFENEAFDIVVSCECLEHVPHPQKMIDELYRVIKKEGNVILTTENYCNAYAYYIAFIKLRGKKFDSGSSVQPIEHFFVFWRVLKKFRKAGFKKIKTYSKQYVLLLIPGKAPDTFTIMETKSKFFRFLLKPFGRRYTYLATK
jgi:ubiquinone/menaquinone biosynthesis C-methylase UbiE